MGRRGVFALSRRFSPLLFAAAGGLLLAAGLVVILSSPMRANSRSARANRNAPGSLHARARIAREAFFLSKRGLSFGLPPGAYRKAIAQMRLQERDSVGASRLNAPDSTAGCRLFRLDPPGRLRRRRMRLPPLAASRWDQRSLA